MRTLQNVNSPLVRKFPLGYWFTLVELIVVITILAILATVGFISLQGFAADARDSSRLTSASMLGRGLTLRFTQTGDYPMPDSAVSITASSYPVAYQGVAGITVLSKASLSKAKDPLDGKNISYAVSADLSKYQVVTFLEWRTAAVNFVPEAVAASPTTAKRYPSFLWDPIGLILNADSTPVNETGTPVDLVTATGTYSIQYDANRSVTGTWAALRGAVAWAGLVWYWTFDETSWTGVFDLSGNDSTGVFSGAVAIARSPGKLQWALDFSANSWATSASWGYVDFGTLKWLKWGEGGTPHSIAAWIRVSRPLCSDTNACRQWILLLGSPWTGSHHWLVGGEHGPTQFWVWSGPQVKWFPYTPGDWQHVVITFDGRTLVGYVNGQKVPSSSQWGATAFNLQDFRFFVGWWVQEAPFDGKIDELRVYSKALSANEALNLYRTSQ